MLPIGRPVSLTVGEDQEENEFETYLLLLLSDSNLPTGGFVASSGLESFYAHGLLHNSRPTPNLTKYGVSSTRPNSATTKRPTAPSQAQLSSATLSFARSTLHSYSRSSFPFLTRVHATVTSYLDNGVRATIDHDHSRNSVSPAEEDAAETVFQAQESARLVACLDTISKLDYSYHTLLLNHVARRASKAQGIALLTLYSKAFAKPINLDREPFSGLNPSDPIQTSSANHDPAREQTRIELAAKLVDRLKMDIRKSAAKGGRDGVKVSCRHGHLPICWAVFAACLGISLKKAVFLHLFLQARSLFSSSIRLNTLGPYLAHQIMRFQMRAVVDGVLAEMEREGCLDLPPVEIANQNMSHSVPDNEAKDITEEEIEKQVLQIDETNPKLKPYTIAQDTFPTQGVVKQSSISASKPRKPFRTTATMSTTSQDHLPLRPKVQPLRTGKNQLIPVDDNDPSQGWAWDWPEEQEPFLPHNEHPGNLPESGFWSSPSAPATTFPLGEIIQARHDQLHSRLFNS